MIDVFRQAHLTLEKNLVLNHLTTHHTEPDMKETFAVLLRLMDSAEGTLHTPVAGRKSKYTVADMLDKGLMALLRLGSTGGESVEDGEVTDLQPALEDISLDLDM